MASTIITLSGLFQTLGKLETIKCSRVSKSTPHPYTVIQACVQKHAHYTMMVPQKNFCYIFPVKANSYFHKLRKYRKRTHFYYSHNQWPWERKLHANFTYQCRWKNPKWLLNRIQWSSIYVQTSVYQGSAKTVYKLT